MRRRGFLGLAVALGTAALTEGCVTISPLATTGDFPVDSAFHLPLSQTWNRMKQRDGGSGRIVIGVKADQPGLGYFDAGTNSYSGFDILIARLMAAGLGFDPSQIQFNVVASQDRETELENQALDLIVASYSYTAKRAELVAFAGPYLTTTRGAVGRQVEHGHHRPRLGHLELQGVRGERVHHGHGRRRTAAEPDIAKHLRRVRVRGEEAGEADFVYTDYTLLVGYQNQDPTDLKVINTDAGEQYYGIGLQHNDTQLQAAIDGILQQAISDGTWRAIFNSTLAPEGLKGDPAEDQLLDVLLNRGAAVGGTAPRTPSP